LNTEKMTLSIPEVAETLGISRNLAYELATQDKLPGLIRLGQKRVVCSKLAIERLLQGNGHRSES
jgi:predicted DNA-binding transcriptional regulator AlpA